MPLSGGGGSGAVGPSCGLLSVRLALRPLAHGGVRLERLLKVRRAPQSTEQARRENLPAVGWAEAPHWKDREQGPAARSLCPEEDDQSPSCHSTVPGARGAAMRRPRRGLIPNGRCGQVESSVPTMEPTIGRHHMWCLLQGWITRWCSGDGVLVGMVNLVSKQEVCPARAEFILGGRYKRCGWGATTRPNCPLRPFRRSAAQKRGQVRSQKPTSGQLQLTTHRAGCVGFFLPPAGPSVDVGSVGTVGVCVTESRWPQERDTNQEAVPPYGRRARRYTAVSVLRRSRCRRGVRQAGRELPATDPRATPTGSWPRASMPTNGGSTLRSTLLLGRETSPTTR